MRKYSSTFSALTFTLSLTLLSSCGKTPPKPNEVSKRVIGNYCAEGYRLELRPDSTFFNMRVKMGQMGARPLTETCKGIYSIEYDVSTKEWLINFKKEKSFSIAACEGKQAIWNKEKGWISGDSTITLNEWFDKTVVEKGKCEI